MQLRENMRDYADWMPSWPSGPFELKRHWPLVVTALLFLILVVETVRPYSYWQLDGVQVPSNNGDAAQPEIPAGQLVDLQIFSQRSLFQPLAPLPSQSVGNETLKRIREKLSFNGPGEVQGQKGAYITVKGQGFKFLRVGEGVPNMFTVQKIEQDHVVVDILGHSVEVYR